MQVLIFDDAGYIAGVQSVLLESEVDLAVNDLTKQAGSLWLWKLEKGISESIDNY